MLTDIEAMRLNFMLKNDNKVLEIPIVKIRPNKAQPRKTFDETELAALSASISENGILQPLSVRKSRLRSMSLWQVNAALGLRFWQDCERCHASF